MRQDETCGVWVQHLDERLARLLCSLSHSWRLQSSMYGTWSHYMLQHLQLHARTCRKLPCPLKVKHSEA